MDKEHSIGKHEGQSLDPGTHVESLVVSSSQVSAYGKPKPRIAKTIPTNKRTAGGRGSHHP